MQGDAHTAGAQQEDYLNKGKTSSAATTPITDIPPVQHDPVSTPPSWNTIPPSPPSRLVDKVDSGTSGLRRRPSPGSSRRPVSSLLASVPSPPSASTCRRRASMPLMHMSLSKPLPPTPPPVPSPSTKPIAESPLSASVSAPLADTRSSREDREGTPRASSKSTSRARFHIPSDNEDEGYAVRHGPRRHESDSGSSSKSRVEDSTENSTENSTEFQEKWERKRGEDNARRYHALLELLMTEVSYLRDLRVLVTIYLQQFPTISTRVHMSSSSFMRASPSPSFISTTFGSHSRSNSQSQLLTQPPPPSAFSLNIPSTASQSNTMPGLGKEHEKGKEKEKHKLTLVVSDADVNLVARNAKELLEFHERFVHELRNVMTPFGMSEALDESAVEAEVHRPQNVAHTVVDEAIASVSGKFLNMAQASGFSIYESFCAGHPEATDVVRKVQQHHTSEWEAFEQRCTHLVTGMDCQGRQAMEEFGSVPLSAHAELGGSRLDGFPTVTDSNADLADVFSRRKRRHSTSSVSLMAYGMFSAGSRNTTHLEVVQVKSDPPPDTKGKGQGTRLTFMDYMIKPVQRICKYPLLLDQLKSAKSLWKHKPSSSAVACTPPAAPSEGDASAEQAASAMRDVVASVDEARRKRDVVIKSSLITSRIVAWYSAHPSKETSPPSHLNPDFMNSLGICMLSGSLDVMHYDVANSSNSGPVKVKYYGAFLYAGGYLVLVKVGKSKTVYEPRHWFPLFGFDVVDIDDADGLLPCSFGLFRRDHYFELAAACQKEKEVWLSAIRESVTTSPVWRNEPTPSLHNCTAGVTSALDNEPAEVLALSALQSRRNSFELTDEPESYGTESHATTEPPSRDEPLPRPTAHFSGSRRSSTTSVKALFSPASSDTILIRSTAPLRQLVERGLLDVFSEACLTIRFQAQTHDEELFQAPKASSTMGMSGVMGIAAKSRLSKRESVIVPRRKSFVDGCDLADMEAIAGLGKKNTLSRAKSLAARRQGKKSLRVMAPLPSGRHDNDGETACALDNTDATVESPTPLSQCSSMGTSHAGSALASPTMESRALSPGPATDSMPPASVQGHECARRAEYLTVVDPDWRPKRTRSMVDNVRGFFYSRSSSPTPSIDASSSRASHVDSGLSNTPEDWSQRPPPSRLTRWWKGSLRRRVQSAPEVPRDDPSVSVDVSATIRSSMDTPDVPEEDVAGEVLDAAPMRRTNTLSRRFKPDGKSHLPNRRPSMFSTFPHDPRDTTSTAPAEVAPRKKTKTVSFFHRLHPKTNLGSSD